MEDHLRHHEGAAYPYAPKWEGPYEVVKSNSSGYYKLVRVEDGFRTGPINSKFFKKYFA